MRATIRSLRHPDEPVASIGTCVSDPARHAYVCAPPPPYELRIRAFPGATRTDVPGTDNGRTLKSPALTTPSAPDVDAASIARITSAECSNPPPTRYGTPPIAIQPPSFQEVDRPRH